MRFSGCGESEHVSSVVNCQLSELKVNQLNI
jgi:hypothetical protein